MSSGFAVFVFRFLFIVVFLGIQFLVYRRAIRWVAPQRNFQPAKRAVVTGLFLFFNIPALFAMFVRPDLNSFPPGFLYGFVYPLFVWHAATLMIGLILAVAFLLKLPFWSVWWLAGKAAPATIEELRSNSAVREFNVSRRKFLRTGMYGLTAVSFGGASYGMASGNGPCDITDREFPIRDLPSSFDGFRIILLSDIHSGPFMSRDRMEEVVQTANSLRPDLILVTGDFVNSRLAEVVPFGEAFASLSAPDGVYGVLGNHDYYTGEVESVAREVGACGITLLRGEETLLRRNGSALSLAGLDDVGSLISAKEQLARTYHAKEAPLPRILMCHRPYYAHAANHYNVDLMLSGHTHGGQVVLGRFGNTTIAPASIASGYVAGSYFVKDTHLYVNRGIGTVGLPIRINCPPEITIMTLRSPERNQDPAA